MVCQYALMISEWEFLARAAVAAILGGTLGLDREMRRAAAGVRTYALVGMGAAAFIAAVILIAQTVEADPSTLNDNQSRMAAGLVAGVGFLGAGAILRTSERIRGLTTAASIWVTAAIGLLIGTGSWILGIGVTILALIIIVGLRPLHESMEEPEDGSDVHDLGP
jgi:putative Mg2+ transporter-C (MgtC) family protein